MTNSPEQYFDITDPEDQLDPDQVDRLCEVDVTADSHPSSDISGIGVTFSARMTLAMAGHEFTEEDNLEDKVLVSPGSHLDNLA